MDRNALLSHLSTEIERFYFERARLVIDARLAMLPPLAPERCGLPALRAAIDRRLPSPSPPAPERTPMATPPKPSLSALLALPGMLAKATSEANTDAEKEAIALAAVVERKDAAFVRIRAHRFKMASGVGELEKFAADVEAVLGGNGAPDDEKKPDPTTAASPPPSDPAPPVGDGRAAVFSDLHPSARVQKF